MYVLAYIELQPVVTWVIANVIGPKLVPYLLVSASEGGCDMSLINYVK